MHRHDNTNRILFTSMGKALVTFAAASLLLFPVCSPGASQRRAQEQQKIFQNAPEEMLKPTRWDSGNTSISNENRLDLFKKHIENLGGGYVGVGTDQNFTLASWAKSDWVWLIDFTKITVAANKIHVAFIKHAPNADAFVALWQPKAKNDAYAVLDKEYAGNPELPYYKATWGPVSFYLRSHADVVKNINKKYNYTTWLTDPQIYNYIRDLALRGRIIPLRGDLMGSVTLMGIGKNSKLMGVPIRVIYLSNAEEFIPAYTDQFIANMKELNIDDKTVLLRTATIYQLQFPWAPGSDYANPLGFHYFVMRGDHFMKWLPENKGKYVYEILRKAAVDPANGISIIMPEQTAVEPKSQK